VDDAAMFLVDAETYDRHVGRYGAMLSSVHLAALDVHPGDRALDVGCGPGMLTGTLADLLGAENVAAVDPSPTFVETCRARVPGADVRLGAAEELPDFGVTFDAVTSQLVLNFLTDADRGVRAMRAVTREGGTVGSMVWDYAEGMTMLRAFWDGATSIDPDAPDEGKTMAYCSPDELAQLWRRCGLREVDTRGLLVDASYSSFEDYWQPFTAGVGPSGSYYQSLDAERRQRLKEATFQHLRSPSGGFKLTARAWFVRGTA
jgi:ubiquinone/menaquinone biosynthesis C-methylase UbiE